MERYETLTEDEIHHMIIDKKWFFEVYNGVEAKYTELGTAFITRLGELFSRYEVTLPLLSSRAEQYEARVSELLSEMGFTW